MLRGETLMEGREKQYLAQHIDQTALKRDSLQSSSLVASIDFMLFCACILTYAKMLGSETLSVH